MRYDYQNSNTLGKDFEFAFDAEVSYAGMWYSVNDHFNYRLTNEGFGQHDAVFRRRTVNSPYFAGEYQTAAVPDKITRAWNVRVFGDDAWELHENLINLINWFTQDSFNVRFRVNEYQETWLAHTADYGVDYTQVNAHNNQMVVKLSFATSPVTTRELLL